MTEEIFDTPPPAPTETPPDKPVLTEEQVSTLYAGMLLSVDCVNAIISGTYQGNESAYEQKKTLRRSVDHLKEVEQEHFNFGDRDLTTIHAAIAAGNAFLAE